MEELKKNQTDMNDAQAPAEESTSLYESLYTDTNDNYESTSMSLDFLDDVMAIAKEKLENLGYVNAIDIVNAFRDTDSYGNRITAFEMRKSYFDAYSYEELSSSSIVTSIEPELFVYASGMFVTVAARYPVNSYEIQTVWRALQDFGEENVKYDQHSMEIPLVTLYAVPFSLGGTYSMVAVNPVFWALQQGEEDGKEYYEIRMLFDAESVMFTKLPFINSQDMVMKLKEAIAMDAYTEEMRALDEEKKIQFEKEREAFLQQYISVSGGKRHTFQTKDVKHTD